jgi:hypothetical protein
MFERLKMAAAKTAVNKFLDGIGVIRELEIDKVEKTIIAQVEFKGETLPLRIKILDYRLGADYIILSQFVCDRQWLEVALNRFLADKEIRIPDNVRKAMTMIM